MEKTLTDLHDNIRTLGHDPDDLTTFMDYVKNQSKIHGSQAYLRCLDKVSIWEALPAGFQDVVIHAVCEIHQDRLSHIATSQFICREYDSSGQIIGPGVQHRIAQFTHKETGLVLNLIPGNGNIKPFLIGETPITREQFKFINTLASAINSRMCNYQNMIILHDDIPMSSVLAPGIEYALKLVGLTVPHVDDWVYAKQANAPTTFYWGDSFCDDFVWYGRNSYRHDLYQACERSVAEFHGDLINDTTLERIRQKLATEIPGAEFNVGVVNDNIQVSFLGQESRGPQPVSAHEDKRNGFGLIDMYGNVREIVSNRPNTRPDRPDAPDFFSIGGSFLSSDEEFGAFAYYDNDYHLIQQTGVRAAMDLY